MNPAWESIKALPDTLGGYAGAEESVIVDAETGNRETIRAGKTAP